MAYRQGKSYPVLINGVSYNAGGTMPFVNQFSPVGCASCDSNKAMAGGGFIDSLGDCLPKQSFTSIGDTTILGMSLTTVAIAAAAAFVAWKFIFDKGKL